MTVILELTSGDYVTFDNVRRFACVSDNNNNVYYQIDYNDDTESVKYKFMDVVGFEVY